MPNLEIGLWANRTAPILSSVLKRSENMRLLIRWLLQWTRRLAVSAHNDVRFNRRALVITDTELKLMAAAAIIGERRMPKNG